MKHVLLTLFMLLSMSAVAGTTTISTSSDILHGLTPISKTIKVLDQYASTAIIQADDSTLRAIEKIAHAQGKCGGYFVHDNLADARNSVARAKGKKGSRSYKVYNSQLVRDSILKVSEKNIQKTIRDLSAFNNRYYQSQTGVDAAKSIAETWRKYARTELYIHKGWKQPSVIATITGSKYPEEIIVIGGHLDSISGYFGRNTARAPGADDNASGIATITEVLRVLSDVKYRPLRTIKFMGYAAEEVGLRGSSEIAKYYASKGVNVIGAMQLDMTNFKGSDETIFLTTDYTNETQTNFLAKLIGTYVKVPFARTKCGYACSDHASWTKAGYAAVFPFEAAKNGMNRKIHTSKDTIEVSGGHAKHATNFAKLGLAYLIEMDLQGVNITR